MISIHGLLDQSLADEAMALEIRGAAPGSRVVLKLATQDDAHVTWKSVVELTASAAGTVRLADTMTLFWSMRPDGSPTQLFAKRTLAPLEYRLEVENSEGQLLLERQFQRAMATPDVVMEKLDASDPTGLAGEFYFPKELRLADLPLVLIFGGSGGGLEFSRRAAALLASRGIPSFALAYFAYPGRPSVLSRISLEYFQQAMKWLRFRAGNDRARVTIIGGSRGGELALILGSTFTDEVTQVVARVPSHVVWGGLGGSLDIAEEFPAWVYQGEPLCHVPLHAVHEVRAEFDELRRRGELISLTPLFLKTVARQNDACRKAAIQVERIQGPVLLISGDDDQTWPSSWFSDQIVERMHAHGKGSQVRHLRYSDAGHSIPLPYFPSTVHDLVHPVDGGKYRNGGTDEGDALAAIDSWKQMLEFIGSA